MKKFATNKKWKVKNTQTHTDTHMGTHIAHTAQRWKNISYVSDKANPDQILYSIISTVLDCTKISLLVLVIISTIVILKQLVGIGLIVNRIVPKDERLNRRNCNIRLGVTDLQRLSTHVDMRNKITCILFISFSTESNTVQNTYKSTHCVCCGMCFGQYFIPQKKNKKKRTRAL